MRFLRGHGEGDALVAVLAAMKRHRDDDDDSAMGLDAVLDESESRAKRARIDGGAPATIGFADIEDIHEMMAEIFVRSGVSPPALIGNYTVAIGRRGQEHGMIRRISSLWFGACLYMFIRKFPARENQPYAPAFVKCVNVIAAMTGTDPFEWGKGGHGLHRLDPMWHPWFDDPARATEARLMWQNVYALCAATTTVVHAYCSYLWPRFLPTVSVMADGAWTGLPVFDEIIRYSYLFVGDSSLYLALGPTNAAIVRDGRMTADREPGANPKYTRWVKGAARRDTSAAEAIDGLLAAGATRSATRDGAVECPVRRDARMTIELLLSSQADDDILTCSVDLATIGTAGDDGVACDLFLKGTDRRAGVLRIRTNVRADSSTAPVLETSLRRTDNVFFESRLVWNGIGLFETIRIDIDFLDIWACLHKFHIGDSHRPWYPTDPSPILKYLERFESVSRRAFITAVFSAKLFADGQEQPPFPPRKATLDNANDYYALYMELASEEETQEEASRPLLTRLLRTPEPIVLYPGEEKRFLPVFEAKKDDD